MHSFVVVFIFIFHLINNLHKMANAHNDVDKMVCALCVWMTVFTMCERPAKVFTTHTILYDKPKRKGNGHDMRGKCVCPLIAIQTTSFCFFDICMACATLLVSVCVWVFCPAEILKFNMCADFLMIWCNAYVALASVFRSFVRHLNAFAMRQWIKPYNIQMISEQAENADWN